MKRNSLAALALLLAFGCQTDRGDRRRPPEPTEPHRTAADISKAVETRTGTAASSATSGAPAPPEASRAQLVPLTRPKEPLNVILLSLEAWRADMPWSGYARPVAPHLSRLAAESSVWGNQRAVSSHGPQALASLLSGRYPSSLYRSGAAQPTFGTDDLFLAEALQKKGIRTLGVQADRYFDKGRGFEQGFDVWDVVPGTGAGAEQAAHGGADQLAARLVELLAQPQNTGHQFFAWAHFMDPSEPYASHPGVTEFGEQPRDRYDAELLFTDGAIGKILEFARRQAWWERTAVIVTGDHGAAFGEHGLSRPSGDLWDVLLQTPLLIHAPGAKPVQIEAARSQIDLAPTVLELMGLPRAPEFVGQSLLPELYGAVAAPRPVLLFELCEDSENPALRALVVGDDKLIVPMAGGDERLFNLKTDPRELENLSESKVGKLQTLAVRFEREWGRIPSVEPSGGMKLRSGRLAQGPEHPKH
jgi:arylsulfatase A-like enzyme